MKKIITLLVGSFILFVWSFLTWSMLQIHKNEFKYTANQDKIINFLNQNLEKDGSYMIPGLPPTATTEDHENFQKVNQGKPWAQVHFRKAMTMSMPMNLLRGFTINLVIVFLIMTLMGQFRSINMGNSIMTCLFIGLIGWMAIPYLNSIWFETESLGYLVDAIVPNLLLGAWLGFMMKD